MSNDAALTNASTPLTIKGVEFELKPLTDRDFVELDEWVRARAMKAALSGLVGVTDKDLRREVISTATETVAALTWLSGPGAKVAASFDGVSRMLYQSVKHKSKLSHEEIRKLMFAPGALDEVMATFNRINRMKFFASKKGTQESEEPKPLTTETPSTTNSSHGYE